jgi:hypothetical protein
MTRSAGTSIITFAATSGTKTINTAGVTFDCPFIFNGVGGTWQLQSALTSGSTRACTLTNGTLDLNGYTATFGAVSSNNSNVRTFAFGSTGKFVLLNTGVTVWTTQTSTNLTVTGTNPLIQLTTNATTGTRSVSIGASGEANAISVDVTAGSDTIAFGVTSGAFKNVNFTGFTGTYTSGSSIFVFGDWNFGGVTAVTATTNTTFTATSGTKTITSNGVSFFGVVFSGVGGAWSLQDALTIASTRGLTLTSGALTTNGYAVTAGFFASSNTSVRALNLGASTVTLVGISTPWNITDPTNMTLNSGTSSLVFTGTTSNIIFQGGGFTYYDITLPTGVANNFQFSGANTFRNLTATNPISPGRRLIILADTTTVTGVLSCSGSAANSRNRVASAITGVPVSFVVNSVSAISDVDFSDITLTGAAAPVSGTRLSDGKGNTGIVFGAGVNKYWNLPAGGVWSDTAWALSSGGAVNVNNFPLAQDTVIFDNTGVGSGTTISIQYGWFIGTFNASTLTNLLTVDWTSATGGQTFLFGNVTLSSAITFTSSGTAPISLSGRRDGGFTTITSAGVVWPQSTININCVSPNSIKLGDNLTASGIGGINLANGALNLNGNILSTPVFSGSSFSTGLTCSIDFNGGSISVSGNNATVWSFSDLTGFSYTGTPTVNLTYSGSVGTRTVNNGATAGGTEANAVDFNITAGSDTTTQTTGSVVRNFNCTGYSGIGGLFSGGFIYGTLTLSATQTIASSSFVTTFAATSGTKTITTNGVSIDRPVEFNGVGGAWSLQDALTLGVERNLDVLAGTFTTNGYAVTIGKFSSGSSGTATGDRTLNLGASSITCLGISSLNSGWQVDDGAYSLTINAGTSTIYLAEAFTGTSQQLFNSSGKTYYNLVFSGGQPGGFRGGNNTFNSISTTVQPFSLVFDPGITQTVNNFNVSGTAGNLVTMTSSTPGTQWGLVKNTGSKALVSYVSITDSAVTPAGYWFAPTSQGNVDGGNNTGWNFGSAGGVTSGFFPFF